MTRPVVLSLLTRPDRARPDPLPVQIYRDLLAAVGRGDLAPGQSLPSSRAAARALGLSRETLNTAFDLLRAEGVIDVRPGAAPRIREGAVPGPAMSENTEDAGIVLPSRGQVLAQNPRAAGYRGRAGLMAPGVPDEDLFPADEWGVALRRAARRHYGSASAYESPHGLVELRGILAERLATDRGIRADPEHILITPGTQGSLALLAQVLADPGECAAIEDPGYPGARAAFLGAGLRVAPVACDDEGICTGQLPDNARLIYVSPSNQYPLGIRMSHARRGALLDYAGRRKAWILEDDYDSEFLWRGREIAALTARSRAGEVIYMGSVAKVLLPALRIGWIVAPPGLAAPLQVAQRNLGLLVNLHAQRALAEMMRTGRYRAHLKRIARAYEPRGRALAQALGQCPGVEVRLPDGGVQLAAIFRDGRAEEEIADALGTAGFRPALLSALCLNAPLRGLVVGFGDATPGRIARFAGALTRAMAAQPL